MTEIAANLIALRAGHAREAFKREPHVTRLGQDGFDAFVRLRIQVLCLFEERGIAKDHGEGIVELTRDVGGKLAESDKLLSIDELFEHHGLAACGLDARGKDFERK